MEETFKPLGDRVLVERVEAKTKTDGGIVIPDTAKEKPLEGKVIFVGISENLILKPGDKVLFGKYVGSEVTLNNKPYLVMRQSDVYSII